MSEQKLSLLDYIGLAIQHNYYFGVVVTSFTQGRVKSMQLPFGIGKTTFAIRAGAIFNSKEFPNNVAKMMKGEKWEPSDEDWRRALENMGYCALDLLKAIEPGRERVNWYIWDDVSLSAPKKKSTDQLISHLSGELEVLRPELAVLCMTCANRLRISAPLREFPKFEIIIPQRGYYEVQGGLIMKDFNNPERDLSHLTYMEEGVFEALPSHVQKQYDNWRVERKKYIRSVEYRKEKKAWLRDYSMGEEEEKKEKKEDEPKDPSRPLKKLAPIPLEKAPTVRQLEMLMKYCGIKVSGDKSNKLHRLLWIERKTYKEIEAELRQPIIVEQ